MFIVQLTLRHTHTHSSLYLLEDDLVALDDPNEGLILHNLRARFAEDKLYTWVGASRSVLVSANPYKQIRNLYDEEAINEQREKRWGFGRFPI
jgi:myosin heavy subunit